MITPTIGRFVLVNNRDVAPKRSQPEPAVVSYVHNDRLINVGGFNAHGQPFHVQSLPLVQPEDEVPASGAYASWMPYQISAVQPSAPSPFSDATAPAEPDKPADTEQH